MDGVVELAALGDFFAVDLLPAPQPAAASGEQAVDFMQIVGELFGTLPDQMMGPEAAPEEDDDERSRRVTVAVPSCPAPTILFHPIEIGVLEVVPPDAPCSKSAQPMPVNEVDPETDVERVVPADPISFSLTIQPAGAPVQTAGEAHVHVVAASAVDAWPVEVQLPVEPLEKVKLPDPMEPPENSKPLDQMEPLERAKPREKEEPLEKVELLEKVEPAKESFRREYAAERRWLAAAPAVLREREAAPLSESRDLRESREVSRGGRGEVEASPGDDVPSVTPRVADETDPRRTEIPKSVEAPRGPSSQVEGDAPTSSKVTARPARAARDLSRSADRRAEEPPNGALELSNSGETHWRQQVEIARQSVAPVVGRPHTAASERPAELHHAATPEVRVAEFQNTTVERPVAVRQLEIRLGEGEGLPVKLNIVERAGRVHVDVRTSDARLTESLRVHVGDLTARIESQGNEVTSWMPGDRVEEGEKVETSSLGADGRWSDAQHRSFAQDRGSREQEQRRAANAWAEYFDWTLNDGAAFERRF